MRWIYYLVVVLLCGLVIALLLRYLRKRAQQAALAPVVILTPHEEAFQALNRLRDSTLLREGNIKEYFIQLSFIMRRYLERRFTCPATEMTTLEIANHCEFLKLGQEDTRELVDLLSECDLAKFAKWRPEPTAILRLFNCTWSLIEQTTELGPPSMTQPALHIEESV